MIAFVPDSFYIFRLRFSVMAKEKSVFVLRRPVSRFVSPVPACPLRGRSVSGAADSRAFGFSRTRGKSGPANPCIGNSSEKKTFEKTMEVGLIVRRGVRTGRMAGIPRIRDLKRLFCGQPKSSVRNQSVAMRSSFG